MGELKERFFSVYNNAVHRDGSDMLLRWLEDSDFFVAPASTKFHGCHEGGLLQHSLNVYACLKRGWQTPDCKTVILRKQSLLFRCFTTFARSTSTRKASAMSKMRRQASGTKKRSMEQNFRDTLITPCKRQGA